MSMLRLELVGVLWLGLVSVFGFRLGVGLGVLGILLVSFEVLVVFVVLLVVFLEARVRMLGFGFDGVDSAWGWLGWRCYGVLAEGLVVGCGWQVGGIVGVLRDLNGLHRRVILGILVGVVGVLRRLLDDRVRLSSVLSIVGVLGDLDGFDAVVGLGVGLGVVGVSVGHGD